MRDDDLVEQCARRSILLNVHMSIACLVRSYFEQVETKEPSLEKKEAIEQTPAQEYIDLLTELSQLNQNISELGEYNVAIYDESSSSKDEGDTLP